jgi:IclR family mhp operon transcriptional activator
MAFAEDEEREMILRFMRVSQDIDLNYLATAEVSLDVERIRAEGYAMQGRNHFNLTPGKTSSIAVPIFKNGRFEAAMTMVFFVAAMKLSAALEMYLDDLKATAAAISHDLSNTPLGNA